MWKKNFGGLRANSNSNSKLELDDFEPSRFPRFTWLDTFSTSNYVTRIELITRRKCGKKNFGGLRANSNSNSKLELDDFEPSWQKHPWLALNRYFVIGWSKKATVFDCSYLQNVWTNLRDFGRLQHHFVMSTSVDSILNKFITQVAPPSDNIKNSVFHLQNYALPLYSNVQFCRNSYTNFSIF